LVSCFQIVTIISGSLSFFFTFSDKENTLKIDRFLIGILVGIGVLVVASLTLFFLRRGETNYTTDPSPKGTIQNYVLALQKKDFEKAYGYLYEAEGKPKLGSFRDTFVSNFENYSRSGVTFGTSSETGDTAFMTVTVQQSYNGPFNEMSRSHDSVDLVKQNGEWKIKKFPYPFWGYDWYENAPKPVN
jgi:hypothetical protein